MKKLLQNILFVLVVALGFMLISTNVYAEEVSSDVSKWTVPPIEKITIKDAVKEYVGILNGGQTLDDNFFYAFTA